MKKVFIAAAKRTAIGKFGGSLSTLPAADLAATVISSLLAESDIPPGDFNEVLMGHVLSAGCNQGPARQAAIKAGLPENVPASSINMVCGSGMKAVMHAYAAIGAGIGQLYIAGGSENMSLAPYLLPQSRTGYRMGHNQVVDHMIKDSLWDAFADIHMGITAENIAEKHNISREAQDTFALQSQQKAINAIDSGAFKDEITPVSIKVKKETRIFADDEFPNRTTNADKLSSLRPAFKADGTVTAGNASGINDGAAFMIIASEEAVEKYGLPPMAEVVAIGQGGVDPNVMGLGPVPAIKAALSSADLKLQDMDILELNEAFASQSLGVVTELAANHQMPMEDILSRTNLNGGAIALGHPVGASGARIMVTLTHLMKKQQATYGLASLCIGGGMGTAVVLRNLC